MNRRESLRTMAGLAGATTLGLGGTAYAAGHKPANLEEALADCSLKGKACVEHCVVQLSQGDKTFAKCLREAREMLAVCEAMHTLVLAGDKNYNRISAACKLYCKECMDACLEHKSHWGHKMHLECKACHDACAEVLKMLS